MDSKLNHTGSLVILQDLVKSTIGHDPEILCLPPPPLYRHRKTKSGVEPFD